MLDNATDVVTIRVEVNAPVIVSHSPDHQIAFEGDTVKMSCAANGIPEPSISWSFNKTREEFSKFPDLRRTASRMCSLVPSSKYVRGENLNS